MQGFIGENIRALRVQKGLSQAQFAVIADVSQSAVSSWECGTTKPHGTTVEKILAAFPDITSDDIYGAETGYAKRVLVKQYTDKGKPVPMQEISLFGSISAGKPIEMIPIEETYPVAKPICDRHPHCFLLKVTGESMNRHIPNGVYALIDPSVTEVIDGKVFAVCLDDQEATIKRVHLLNDGVELQPDSYDPTFKSTIFDNADRDKHTLTIIGQVVWYFPPYGIEL